MRKITDEHVVQIVEAGGGVIVDTAGELTDHLVQIAAAAARSGAMVILKNADSRRPEELIQIAAAGHGRVIFEL
jgi:hypothetical protein